MNDYEANSKNIIRAEVVYAGIGAPEVPACMGEAREDQLLGTPHENLVELCGRICYDSLGTGRSWLDYHAHLLEVGHLSVHEHARVNFFLEFEEHHRVFEAAYIMGNMNGARAFAVPNRPLALAVSLNLRHIIEWTRNTEWLSEDYMESDLPHLARNIGLVIAKVGNSVAPNIIPTPPAPLSSPAVRAVSVFSYTKALREVPDFRDHVLVPQTSHITMYLAGSRHFSHEQVRHRFAISQRSTRYVDEADSPIAMHPIIQKYAPDHLKESILEQIREGRANYSFLVPAIEAAMPEEIAKLSRRKAARGAARMVLEGSLPTEMMFTASISDWKGMINQRCKEWADAEIRLVYNEILQALVHHPYTARYFNKAKVEKSKDGLGFHLYEDLK